MGNKIQFPKPISVPTSAKMQTKAKKRRQQSKNLPPMKSVIYSLKLHWMIFCLESKHLQCHMNNCPLLTCCFKQLEKFSGRR